MKRIAVLITFALLLSLASAAYAKKGGGGGKPGGGGDPGNTTPLDILVTVSGTLYAIQDDGTGETALASIRGGAAWSPDGTQVAFYGLQDGFGIYLMDVDGGTPQLLIPMQNLTAGQLDWCPDGSQRLAFTMRETEGSDVFVASFDDTGVLGTENVTNVAGPGSGYMHPTWSPDGNQIAVLYPTTRIRVVDLVNRDEEGLPTVHTVYESSRFRPSWPVWSKTGNQIAFKAYDDDATDPLNDLFILEVTQASDGTWTGAASVNVTNTPDDEEDAADWSPDDTRLVFANSHWKASRRGTSKTNLQMLTLDTGSRQVLSDRGSHPHWRRSAP